MKKHGLHRFISGMLTAALCAGMLPAAFAASPTTITKDNVTVLGDAYYDAQNGHFVLTEEETWQSGAIWFNQVKCNNDFALSMEFYTGHAEHEDDYGGADGICVAFYADGNSIGDEGYALGFDGCGGYGVAIDTYQNSNFGDPEYNHIAIVKETNNNHLQMADATAFTEDGKWHLLRVENHNQVCTVLVDGAKTLELDGVEPTGKYSIGITAGTGDGCNYHAVRNIVLDEAVWDEAPSSEKYTTGKKYTFNGHEYQLFTEEMTPPEAEKYCDKLGGHLVTITSQQEQDFVAQMAEDIGVAAFSIGATDRDEEGTWTWMTGEPWDYTNWYPGGSAGTAEPNNGLGRGDDYGLSNADRGWKWTDYFGGYDNYTSKAPFICEWDGLRSTLPKESEPQQPASKDTTSFGSHVSEWSAKEMEKAYEMKLIPEKLVGEDLTRQINRAEFAAVAVKTYESLLGVKAIPTVNNPFTDCNDTEVLKAYSIGAVKGTSNTQFSPNALLNREQAAAMLTRVFKRITLAGWTLDTDSQFTLPYDKPAAFADDADISGWAKDSVYFMVANKIISGTGNNKFAPKNTTSAQEAQGYANATREQALAIAVRMVENLKD